MICKTNIIIT